MKRQFCKICCLDVVLQSHGLQSRYLAAITEVSCEGLVRLVDDQTDGTGHNYCAKMFTKVIFLLVSNFQETFLTVHQLVCHESLPFYSYRSPSTSFWVHLDCCSHLSPTGTAAVLRLQGLLVPSTPAGSQRRCRRRVRVQQMPAARQRASGAPPSTPPRSTFSSQEAIRHTARGAPHVTPPQMTLHPACIAWELSCRQQLSKGSHCQPLCQLTIPSSCLAPKTQRSVPNALLCSYG